MIRTVLIVGLLMTEGLFIEPALSFSQPAWGGRDRRPYGGYCQGPRGGRYGAKNPVKNAEEARTLLKRYFEGQDVVIGKISERGWHFEADIRGNTGNAVDRVIVDKRTGRIRSIY